MFLRFVKYFPNVLLLVCDAFLPASVFSKQPAPETEMEWQIPVGATAGGLNRVFMLVDLDVYVNGPNGAAIEGTAVVTLMKLDGQTYRQETTKAGYVRFNGVAATEYKVQVVAPAYEREVKRLDTQGNSLMKVTIELRPISDVENAGMATRLAALAPKAQKEVGKAMEALRSKNSAEARNHLEAANRLAPNHPEVNYLYGVYSSQMSDWPQAKSYWTKTLDLYPKHLLALLSLAEDFLHENKPAEALPYLSRAVEAEPSSWRAHAIYAEAYVRLRSPDEVIKEAERAMELGHGQAATVQPLLGWAFAARGEKDRAVSILQAYLHDHPADAATKQQLENLQSALVLPAPEDASVASGAPTPSAAGVAATELPLPSSWLPPDVDEKVPPVEPGATCALDEVVQKAGKRIEEFVGNVDRFTATEFLMHESINKWGMASSPEKRKFDYLVSIAETRPGLLNVEEYRSGGTSAGELPEGVATNGLPALVLVFHPVNAGNFEMKCEGLARSNGGLAWQIHFRQRKDKPNTMRAYRLGVDGPSYAVALKGRAWIAADNYQIVRLETDMVAPLPQIRLAADHTAIEYGPVEFRNRKVNMWLPRSAEVYFDWRGKRIHRRHSFSNYLLFSIDEKQRIFDPKSDK